MEHTEYCSTKLELPQHCAQCSGAVIPKGCDTALQESCLIPPTPTADNKTKSQEPSCVLDDQAPAPQNPPVFVVTDRQHTKGTAAWEYHKQNHTDKYHNDWLFPNSFHFRFVYT